MKKRIMIKLKIKVNSSREGGCTDPITDVINITGNAFLILVSEIKFSLMVENANEGNC